MSIQMQITPTPENPYKVYKAYKADGTELDPNATYTVVINDFLFGGGDSFSALTGGRFVGAIQPDTEVFVSISRGLEAAGQPVSASITGVKTTSRLNKLQLSKQPLRKWRFHLKLNVWKTLLCQKELKSGDQRC